MEAEELAWAAGFFDGEGSTCRIGRGICMTVQQIHRGTLERFQDAVGLGRIYGPYVYKDGRSPRFDWRVYRFHDVEEILEMLWPWLSAPKREQAERVVTEFIARPRMPGRARIRMSDDLRATL